MSEIIVHHGDSRVVLGGIADNSIDSCACDPPYALVSIGKRFGKEGAAPAKAGKTGAYARASAGFMGQKWDTGETAFDPAFWEEVFRVLKPGAFLIAFSATRTYHRLACAIEDAGFEIRDMLAWLYGSGFPKSHDITALVGDDGRIVRPRVPDPAFADGPFAEGMGTALKPALEPVVFARKPLIGTVAENLLVHGTGALNIGACRVDTAESLGGGAYAEVGGRQVSGSLRAGSGMNVAGKTAGRDFEQPTGRWPANVLHDGSEEVLAAFPDAPRQKADISASAPSPKTSRVYGKMRREGEASAERRYADKGSTNFAVLPGQRRGDSGSAARFFYTAKADAEDRLGSKHPTVKPVDLMAWLCRLVTPPGGVVLDPFAGSGTTGLAAMREGFGAILIEREEPYVADIKRRIAWARGEGRLTSLEMARLDEPENAAKAAGADLPLFGGGA